MMATYSPRLSRLLLLVLFLFLTGAPRTLLGQDSSSHHTKTSLSEKGIQNLTDALNDYVDENRLPGIVAMILKDGEPAFEYAYGWRDRESQDSIRTSTIFRIASQSKAIISAGILILQEEGKLIVTAPVSTYLPEFAKTTVAVKTDSGYDVVPATRQIRVRDLLSHTSGVGYGYGLAAAEWEEAEIQGWYFGHRSEPIRETVRRMAALPFETQPGTAFVYGYNTDILGAVIEEASGMSLDAFLYDRIFKPLGMTDTHFYLPKDKESRLATVYTTVDEQLTRAPDTSNMSGQGAYVDGPRASFSGGAGLLSTAKDYASFLQMVLNGGSLHGNRVMSPASVESMLSNHIGHLENSNGTGFGLGFQIITDVGAYGALTSLGELGWGGAYHSNYWASQQHNMVVVYFTQIVPPTGRLDDHAKLRALAYGALTQE